MNSGMADALQAHHVFISLYKLNMFWKCLSLIRRYTKCPMASEPVVMAHAIIGKEMS